MHAILHACILRVHAYSMCMHVHAHGVHTTACTLQVLWMASLPSALFGLGLANCFLFKRYGAPVVYCMALSALCLGFVLLVLAPFSPAALTGLLNPTLTPTLTPTPTLTLTLTSTLPLPLPYPYP